MSKREPEWSKRAGKESAEEGQTEQEEGDMVWVQSLQVSKLLPLSYSPLCLTVKVYIIFKTTPKKAMWM